MRNTFILGGGLASTLLLAACAGGERQPQQKPLNIIHIMTDDHSYQTISAYGHALGKLAPTPNLDRLAAERVPPDARMQGKVCWYVYDPAEGCPEENILPGTPFRDLPDEFVCPDCGHPKSAFIPADEDH